MNERRRERGELLPPASDGFTRGMLAGAADIRRHELKRKRRARYIMAAAALALLAVGLGVAVRSLNAPRPDNVVQPVSPNRVIAAPTDAPTPTPEATDDPGAWELVDTPQAREDPEYGRIFLLDDGPFELGDWLCLTSKDGMLDYGLNVPIYQTPSFDDTHQAAATVGMMVQYVEAAGNGFSKVRFAGIEGYVETASLRRGVATPLPEGNYVISEADLFFTGHNGRIYLQTLFEEDDVANYALLKLLGTLKAANPPIAGQYADLPFGAVLVVDLQDAEHPMFYPNGTERFIRLSFALPRNGSMVLMQGDGSLYTFSQTDASFFWSIFGVIREELW